ncbi:MAG: hypothetical protein ACUVQY_10350, partial [Thermoproteota archaeon]
MRVYVLFHNPGDDQPRRLNEALKGKGGYVDAQIKISCIQFSDGWLIVCYDEEPNAEMRKVITEKVTEVKPQVKYLFIHRTTQERTPNIVQQQISVLPDSIIYKYSHVESDPIYNGLVRILTQSQLADIDRYIQISYIQERIKLLSVLKHRIVHLFLPLDIDLQGIAEVKKKDKVKANEYLNEVLEEVSKEVLKEKEPASNYYRQKLADLWYMVARKENGKSEKKLLANGQAIIDLISEQLKKSEVKDQQQDVVTYWTKLLGNCGLTFNEDAPLDPSKIQPDENSEIFKFMFKLDECVTNQKCDNIDEILKFDKTSEIFFHKWFCALDECLD